MHRRLDRESPVTVLTALELLSASVPLPDAHAGSLARWLACPSHGVSPSAGCWAVRSTWSLLSARLRPAFSLLAPPVPSPSTCRQQECRLVPGAPDPPPPCTCCLICKTARWTHRPADPQTCWAWECRLLAVVSRQLLSASAPRHPLLGGQGPGSGSHGSPQRPVPPWRPEDPALVDGWAAGEEAEAPTFSEQASRWFSTCRLCVLAR